MTRPAAAPICVQKRSVSNAEELAAAIEGVALYLGGFIVVSLVIIECLRLVKDGIGVDIAERVGIGCLQSEVVHIKHSLICFWLQLYGRFQLFVDVIELILQAQTLYRLKDRFTNIVWYKYLSILPSF